MGIKNRRIKLISLIGIAVILFSAVSAGWSSPVEAKTARTARVVDVTGTVLITKAGGSKQFQAYKEMSLNYGDHISTAVQSGVVLEIVDHQDEVTIGENSSVYISELDDKNGGKKSVFKLWAGSIWVKAKKLLGQNDQFNVETPTTVMGIRGTQFFAGVDTQTGMTKAVVGAGVVAVTVKEANPGGAKPTEKTQMIYPFMQMDVLPGGQSGQPANVVLAPIDFKQFVNSASSAIIEAIVRNKKALDQEQEEFINLQKQLLEQHASSPSLQQIGLVSPLDLQRYQTNLMNLVGNIVNTAIAEQKIERQRIQEEIDRVNPQLDNKIDLQQVEPPELTETQKKQQEQLNQLEEAQQHLLIEQNLTREDLIRQNLELLQRVNQQMHNQSKLEQEALKAQEKAALNEYFAKLDENKRNEFEKAKEKLQTPFPTPTPSNSSSHSNSNKKLGHTVNFPGGSQPIIYGKPYLIQNSSVVAVDQSLVLTATSVVDAVYLSGIQLLDSSNHALSGVNAAMSAPLQIIGGYMQITITHPTFNPGSVYTLVIPAGAVKNAYSGLTNDAVNFSFTSTGTPPLSDVAADNVKLVYNPDAPSVYLLSDAHAGNTKWRDSGLADGDTIKISVGSQAATYTLQLHNMAVLTDKDGDPTRNAIILDLSASSGAVTFTHSALAFRNELYHGAKATVSLQKAGESTWTSGIPIDALQEIVVNQPAANDPFGINLSWNTVTSAVYYDVRVNGMIVASTSSLTFPVSGLDAGTNYNLTVDALDGQHQPVGWGTVTAATYAVDPIPNLTVVTTYTTAALAWSSYFQPTTLGSIG